MRNCRTIWGGVVIVAAVLGMVVVRSSSGQPSQDPPTVAGSTASSAPNPIEPVLNRYCLNCHGESKPKAGLDLGALLKLGDDTKSFEKWQRVLEVLEAGEMPPDKKPKPSAEESAGLTRWIEAKLAKVGCDAPRPERVTLRRLNRAEYNNTIRDLIGIDFHPADDFPSDDVGYGFDNIGDVLTIPPILLEKYLAAAEAITERAILADSRLDIPVKRWEVEDQPDRVGGEPFEKVGRVLKSNGAITTRFNPTTEEAAEYLLRARVWGQQAGSEPVRVDLQVDGKTVHSAEVSATKDAPQLIETKVRLRPGRREVSVAFVNAFVVPVNDEIAPGERKLIVDWMELKGPLGLDRPLPESHKRIFITEAKDGDWRPAARAILERFVTRAYRRPARPAEVDRLIRLVEAVVKDGERYERGIQLAVQAVLASPHFLFRAESQPLVAAEPSLRQYAVASRLSYFLWSSMPDKELFELAAKGALDDPATLDAQVRRMLKDSKSQALTENFVDQWLTLRNLRIVNPDPKTFPSFNELLRGSMLRETELFAESILREDRNLLEFLDASYTFLNERLAKHYGIEGVEGDNFRRVELPPGSPRGGLLTQASILTVTSNPTRTSPVKRGKWILEQLLGTPPPPPPPNVPELSDAQNVVLSGSLRQRMEQHRADPNCATCHQRMDPLGFGFENFDAVGAWRDKDAGFPIDPSGSLPSGQAFQGPAELKKVLKDKRKEFLRCLTEKMMTYALGRGIELYDRCAVDKVIEAVEKDGYKSSRLILAIIQSEEFGLRTDQGEKR
jgi:hypothetical protein